MEAFKKVSAVATVFSLVLGLAGPMTAFAAAGVSPVLVGSSSYSVLGATTVTCTGATTVTGNVGVSTGTSITGFPTPCTVSPGTTQSNTVGAIAAQADNLSAYGALDAQTCTPGNTFGAVDLPTQFPGGVPPGVYCSTSTFSVNGPLTLTGSGVWIFKMVSGLNTSTGSTASVTGGDACNVWWKVGSSAVIGTGTIFKGNILALTDIALQTGATLDGRAMAQTGQVTLDANTISGPTCTTVVPPPLGSSNQAAAGTINVVKTVINDNGGTKTVADFPLFMNGTPVVSGVTNTFFPAAAYDITETSDLTKYTRSFSSDCDANGRLALNAGENLFCIVTNDDIGAPAVVPVVPPLIDVVKVPSPLALLGGPGSVTYTYTLRNVGTVPVTDVTMVDDSCSPALVSGDANGDAKLDVAETWTYRCNKLLSTSHTNNVVATGWANGISASDIATATVVVGVPLIPPLIHVTKLPSPLTLPTAGGMVTYTEKVTNPGTVALSNVKLTDDTCAPMNLVSGDANGDAKLDVAETWTYTCSAKLTKTTLNTATATGEANGFTVRDIALATVVVAAAVPALPKTGLLPLVGVPAWEALAGLLAASFVLFFVLRKSRAE